MFCTLLYLDKPSSLTKVMGSKLLPADANMAEPEVPAEVERVQNGGFGLQELDT